MKKTLFVALAMLPVLASKAQFPSVGVQSGISYSSFHIRYKQPSNDSRYPANVDYKPGAFAYYGINLTVWKNERFSVRPGIAMLAKGFSQVLDLQDSVGNYAGTAAVSEKVRYLSISLDVTARLADNRFSPYLIAGPRIDDMLHQSTTIDGRKDGTTYPYTQTLFGLNTGAGLIYKVNDCFAVNAELMYRWQLTSIYPENEDIHEAFHRCSTLTLGLQYNFPKREEGQEKRPELPFP